MSEDRPEQIGQTSERVESQDQDLHQIGDRLEKIHEDLQGIIKYIDWLGRRMDEGFKLICARLDASIAEERRFLARLKRQERDEPPRRRRWKHQLLARELFLKKSLHVFNASC